MKWTTKQSGDTQITAHNDSFCILKNIRNAQVINQCCNYVHFDGLLLSLVICYACQNIKCSSPKKKESEKRSSCLKVDKSFDQ